MSLNLVFYFFLLMTALALPAVSKASVSAQSCQNLANQEKIQRIDSWVKFDSYLPSYGSLALQISNNFIASGLVLADDPKVKVGRFQANWDDRNRILEINLIRIEEAFQGQGLSLFVFDRLLKLIPPHEINLITATLAFDNKKHFLKAWELSHGNLDAALKATPFYKAFMKLGFSEIVETESFYLPEIGSLRIALKKSNSPTRPLFKETKLILLPESTGPTAAN